MSAIDYKSFFDYAKLEIGIQDYFIASGLFCRPETSEDWTPEMGIIPIYTAFESASFEKNTPRLALDLSGIAPVKLHAQAHIGADSIVRTTLYRARIRITIDTTANYTSHTDIRATAAAFASEMAPFVSSAVDSATLGANQFLEFFALVLVDDAGQDTAITSDDGFYTSSLNYNLTFGWRREKLPA